MKQQLLSFAVMFLFVASSCSLTLSMNKKLRSISAISSLYELAIQPSADQLMQLVKSSNCYLDEIKRIEATIPHDLLSGIGIHLLSTLIESGNQPAIRYVLKNWDIKPIKDTNSTESTLHIAVQTGDVNAVKKLLKKGFNPNCRWGESFDTPLHTAARFNNSADITKLLLDKGANKNAFNVDKRTPLHIAATRYQARTIFAELVQEGASTNIKVAHNLSIIHYATMIGLTREELSKSTRKYPGTPHLTTRRT
jgi:ankyrin repeat protein